MHLSKFLKEDEIFGGRKFIHAQGGHSDVNEFELTFEI